MRHSQPSDIFRRLLSSSILTADVCHVASSILYLPRRFMFFFTLLTLQKVSDIFPSYIFSNTSFSLLHPLRKSSVHLKSFQRIHYYSRPLPNRTAYDNISYHVLFAEDSFFIFLTPASNSPPSQCRTPPAQPPSWERPSCQPGSYTS